MKKIVASLLFLTASLDAEAKKENPLLENLIYTIREPRTDAPTFRRALSKIGEQLGAKVLSSLSQKQIEVVTLTGAKAAHNLHAEDPILITILRAGLPLLHGVQEIFPHAEVGFIGMSRDEKTLASKTSYIALPPLNGRTVILTDTMLATGGSMLDAIKILESKNAKKIIVICAIASEKGISKIKKERPHIEVFAAAIDPILNEHGYIVPGLGDAGDRCFGEKLA